MLQLIRWIIRPVFLLTMLPICGLIAIMDSNNGRGFKTNLREIMGEGHKPK